MTSKNRLNEIQWDSPDLQANSSYIIDTAPRLQNSAWKTENIVC